MKSLEKLERLERDDFDDDLAEHESELNTLVSENLSESEENEPIVDSYGSAVAALEGFFHRQGDAYQVLESYYLTDLRMAFTDSCDNPLAEIAIQYFNSRVQGGSSYGKRNRELTNHLFPKGDWRPMLAVARRLANLMQNEDTPRSSDETKQLIGILAYLTDREPEYIQLIAPYVAIFSGSIDYELQTIENRFMASFREKSGPEINEQQVERAMLRLLDTYSSQIGDRVSRRDLSSLKLIFPLCHIESGKMDAVRKRAREIFGDWLGKQGLPERLIDSWQCCLGEDSESNFQKNVEVLALLEEKAPGLQVASTLHKDFGIEIFGRYYFSVLLDQYHQREAVMPYILAIMTLEDHNGAFYHTGDALRVQADKRRGWEARGHQADAEPCAVRVAECSTGFGALRAALRLTRSYGRADVLLFGGHGNEGVINFGPYKPAPSTSVITARELQGRTTKELKKCLKDGGIIILESCLTGSGDNPIGAELALRSGLTVIAPNQSAGVYNLSIVETSSGEITHNIAYRYDAHAMCFAPQREEERRV